jgi:REP element-mobilizing transposase RayT
MSTVAIHAIWTTYLTWPPGDPRGHWSSLFDLDGRLIEKGDKLNVPDRETYRRSKELAKEPERVLTPGDQKVIAETIGRVLSEDFEGRVPVYAGAVERTHTHLLLGPCTYPIDEFVGRIKSKTSSAVIREGSEAWRTRTWTHGYWKVFVFDVTAIPDIQNYIEHHNRRRGMAPAPYAWITPFV